MLRLKQGGEELSWGPSIPALNDWIKTELMRLAEGPALTPTPHPGPEPLNALFRAWLTNTVLGTSKNPCYKKIELLIPTKSSDVR